MDLHETLAKLTRHTLFKEWHAKNPQYYLAHAFVMLDEPNKGTWQIGFYNKEKERMITFFVSDAVQQSEEQEVLKEKAGIDELKPEKVKVSVDDALKTAQKCMEENYKAENPMKQFFIIQHIEGHTMFNITFFTQSLKTINIKINAVDGNILKHSIQSLTAFT